MASTENPTQINVEHLLCNVKQLSPKELDEFIQKFTEWRQQGETLIDEDVDPNASDAEVLAFIRKNSRLPETENRRYWQLRYKREDEVLSENEMAEYEGLIRRLDAINIKRLKALAILVKRWEKPVKEIMAELDLFVDHFDEPQFSEEITQEDCSETPN